MKWNTFTVQELIELGYIEPPMDGNHGSLHPKTSDYVEEGIPFLMVNDMKDGEIDFENCAFISEKQAHTLRKGFAKPGDVLLSHKATIGRTAIVPSEYDTIVLTPQITYYRVKKGINNRYLKYYFDSPVFQGTFENWANSGSTRAYLGITAQHNLPIQFPDLMNQEKIASILGALDAKIVFNKKINKNLSNLLQAIYQKRFGEVSLGAKQGILSDICSYSKEKVAVSELNVNTYFSTENMLPEKAGSTKATSLPTMPQTTACRKGDTLISNIRPYFKKIVYCEDMCGCSTDVLCFTPVQSQYAAYLFSTLYTDKFFAFMVAGSKGTKMPRGDKQQIMTYPVVVPAESELEEFNAIAFPVLEQLNSNKAENKRLSALRDALLPKLMSGEIDISAIDL